MDVNQMTSATHDRLTDRMKQEPQEFIALAMDETHDTRGEGLRPAYTYYEVRGPAKLVKNQVDQLFVSWAPEEYATTVTRRAYSSDGRYAIMIVRRTNSCE